MGTLGKGAGAYEVRIRPGDRGILDSMVGFHGAAGTLHFHGFEVRVLGVAVAVDQEVGNLCQDEIACVDLVELGQFVSDFGRWNLASRTAISSTVVVGDQA